MENISNLKTPILSICIPTYSRANYLKENIENILPQLKRYRESVELLVFDNCSVDDTEQLIKRYANKDIEYKRQEENRGYLYNVEDLITHAKGEYILILGDDDLLCPNFLDIFVPLLEGRKYSIIHFNRLVGDAYCSNNRLHDPINDNLMGEYEFPNFLKRVMSSPNFMSSLMFKKGIWVNGENSDYSIYYGYEWLARIYLSMKNELCLYYYFPAVIMRNPVREWSDKGFLYLVIGMGNLFRELDKIVPGVYEKWQLRLRKSSFYDFNYIISGIYVNQELYRKHQFELLNECRCRYERLIAKFFLNAPLGKYCQFIYLKVLNIYRFFTGKAMFVRKI